MFTKTIVLIMACFLIGCGPPANRVLEQKIEQVYQVDPEGSISIRNGEGSIHIYGSDISEVKLEAIKKAYNKERLDKIAIKVSAQPTSISIETIFPPKPEWGFSDRSGTVDYTLFVPQTARIAQVESSNGEIVIEGMRGANVQARLGNGRLFVRNSFCDLKVGIDHGTLTVIYDWWEQRKFSVDARINHGDTVFFMPGGASFHLMAEADRGKISNDFTRVNERDGSEMKKIDRVIGAAATAEVKIHAAAGNIQISEQNP